MAINNFIPQQTISNGEYCIYRNYYVLAAKSTLKLLITITLSISICYTD